MTATDNTVIISRDFAAPAELVWAAWTEPERIKQWWGPKDFTSPHIRNDLRVGGTFLYAMHGPAGTIFNSDMWSTGTYEAVEPFKRIVSTQSFADADGNVVSPTQYGMTDFPESLRLTVTFEALDESHTRLTLSYEGMPAGDNAANMEQGWNQSLDKLAGSLQRV